MSKTLGSIPLAASPVCHLHQCFRKWFGLVPGHPGDDCTTLDVLEMLVSLLRAYAIRRHGYLVGIKGAFVAEGLVGLKGRVLSTAAIW